ncbi:MAG: hypothetical protein ABMA00_18180 [Gemmatimonas sp.]
MSSDSRIATTGVRQLVALDVPELLSLARDEIPDTMAARLGPRFAERYHRALIAEPLTRLDGYYMDGQLMGFIVYSDDAREALRRAFARDRLPFVIALAWSVFSPRRLAYVSRIAWSVLGGREEPGGHMTAEVLTIAVRRAARGGGSLRQERGTNIPHVLMGGAFDYLRSRGVSEVKVFCKPEGLEPIANAFMRKEGFALQERCVRYGIPTNLYVKSLVAPTTER